MLLSSITYGAQWPSEIQLHDRTVSLQTHSTSYTTYWTTPGHQVTRLASLASLETTIWLTIYIRWRSIPFSPSIVISHLCYKVRFLVLTPTICTSSVFSTVFFWVDLYASLSRSSDASSSTSPGSSWTCWLCYAANTSGKPMGLTPAWLHYVSSINIITMSPW